MSNLCSKETEKKCISFYKELYQKALSDNVSTSKELMTYKELMTEVITDLDKLLYDVKNKAMYNVGQFLVRLEEIQDKLGGKR